jgi:carbamoylphosphate synthase large subunit
MVLPCDELARLQLQRLHREALLLNTEPAQFLRDSIERSLGDPAGYPVIESRSSFLALAAEEGIPVAETLPLASIDDLQDWLAQQSLPAVLKADETSGGEGVEIVETPGQARRAFRSLRAPLATAVVAKRTLIDHDPNLVGPWLRQREREVSIQSFVRGSDANIAVACWQGEVLAGISVEVMRSGFSKGPSAIVRILPDGPMLRAAKNIVRRLGVSGMCGLDFMVEEKSAIPHLIEINARATQTGHLPLGPSHDLPAALFAAMSGKPPREREPMIQNDIVALFPLAWQSAPTSPLLKSGFHDVPWEEPRLVRAGMASPSPINYPNLLRLWARLRPSGLKSAERGL